MAWLGQRLRFRNSNNCIALLTWSSKLINLSIYFSIIDCWLVSLLSFKRNALCNCLNSMLEKTNGECFCVSKEMQRASKGELPSLHEISKQDLFQYKLQVISIPIIWSKLLFNSCHFTWTVYQRDVVFFNIWHYSTFILQQICVILH